MRLILNKALDNINDNVNLKIIEITSTDFLNNNLDYFVYKYQIPLIKFTDTQEIFNIKNFKIELSSSLSETELILTESDLELLSGGSGGGTQDLQSVLNNGNQSTNQEILLIGTQIIGRNGDSSKGLLFDVQEGTILFENLDGGNLLGQVTLRADNVTNSFYNLNFPDKPTGVYTFATLDDIKKIDLSDRVYENNAAAISGGLTTNDVYRTSTGELRIVV